MKEKLFRFIINHKVIVVVLLLIVTLFFGKFAAQIKFDSSIESYFIEEDVEEYDRFLEQFGTDELIVLAFEDKDVFTVENLRIIDSISKKLAKLPHITRVLSLTTIKIAYGDEESAYFDSLIKKLPDTPEELIPIKERAFKDPFIPGVLISPTGTKTAIIAEIEHIIGENKYKHDAVNRVKKIKTEEETRTGKHFYIAGGPIVDEALFRYNQGDQAKFTPIMMLLVIIILFIMFRRLIMVFLPILVIILSVTWTYGLMSFLGYKMNLVSATIGPLLIAIAIADSIHLISGYLQEIGRGEKDKVECIRDSFVHLVMPCFMTSITTAFGLLALLSSDVLFVRQFGLVAAGGVLIAFLITVFLLPVLLFIIPFPKAKYREKIKNDLFNRLLVWLGNWQKAKAIIIIAVTILVLVILAPKLPQLTVGSPSIEYFKENDIVRTQVEWIDSGVGGTTTLEFFIETEKENALKDPGMLRKIEQFQNYLENIPGITGVVSPADMVKALNRAYNEGNEENFVIPSSPAEIAQYLLLAEGSKDHESLFSDDYSKGRIIARVIMTKVRQLSPRIPGIKKEMQRIFENTAKVTPTGIIYLMNRMEHYLLSSQLKTFTLAFIVIFILILIMLRSLKIGIFAIIPNFLPILFTIALMPVLGVALDVGTVMIACIALGLVVDDTIHFLTRIKLEMKDAKDTREAISKAIIRVGRPIIYTSIILGFGVLVFVFASFYPVINFGIILSIVIILALIFDLMVLPAIMGFFRLAPKQKS
jgi:predicted RND superfamily exporter protein